MRESLDISAQDNPCPGGHYWTIILVSFLSLSQVTAIHLKISSAAAKRSPGHQM